MKTEAQAKAILKAWKESELLQEGQYLSPKFKDKTTGCVRVNQALLSEMRQQAMSGFSTDE